jgi:hypothetical protein
MQILFWALSDVFSMLILVYYYPSNIEFDSLIDVGNR